MKLLCMIWRHLPYPISHFYECVNTDHEWHAFVAGFCYPACKIWGFPIITREELGQEGHYFMAGVLLSTITMIASAVLIVKMFT